MKKSVEINTENIEKYTYKAKNNLSNYIARKKDYMMDVSLYNNNLIIINKELSYTLTRIEELINEIRELSKRISSLEKSKVSLAYSHNLLLGDKDKTNDIIYKINESRYYYSEIIDVLNNLTRRRDELKDILEFHKKETRILVLRKKHFSKKLNKSNKNVDICIYNMNACYKTLNRLDNIYLNKIGGVSEKYITPKVKRFK